MNKSCLIIINNMSGAFSAVNENKLLNGFGKGFDTTLFHITKETPFLEYKPFDRVVICGGDGTLNRILNLYKDSSSELIYCPFGTLNETSKRDFKHNGEFSIKECGEADNKLFSYVLATGTFTPLGYAVDIKIKQKIRKLAYIINVLKQLKVWRINAKITADDINLEEQFSLVMLLDSMQCFGLKFNKAYKENDGVLHLLTVKAPRFNGFFGLVEMFFPFFRAFFIGFKKPYKSKKMLFTPVKEVNIQTDKQYDFCVDGEKWVMPTSFSVRPTTISREIKVVLPSHLDIK